MAALVSSMRSATTETPATAAAPRPDPAPSAAQVRIVYNAVRTLVPASGTLGLGELLAVTRLDPEPAAAAMRRLAREGPISIHRIAGGDEPTWLVRRAADRREAAE